jgi:hypothetical protein
MHRSNRHLPPKKKQNKVSKPCVPLSSIYEQVKPIIDDISTVFIPSLEYVATINQQSIDALGKAHYLPKRTITEQKALLDYKSIARNPKASILEVQRVFHNLLPHQKRMILEERALHEFSATATGGYDGGGPKPYDADAIAWFSAVEAAGGTITGSLNRGNRKAFNTAFQSLKSTRSSVAGKSLWDVIQQGYFFIGQEEDPNNPGTINPASNGLFVPFKNQLYSGAAINYNFTAYTKTGGILCDSNNYTAVDTRIPNDAPNWPISAYDDKHRHGYVYCENIYESGFIGSLFVSGQAENFLAAWQEGSFGFSFLGTSSPGNPNAPLIMAPNYGYQSSNEDSYDFNFILPSFTLINRNSTVLSPSTPPLMKDGAANGGFGIIHSFVTNTDYRLAFGKNRYYKLSSPTFLGDGGFPPSQNDTIILGVGGNNSRVAYQVNGGSRFLASTFGEGLAYTDFLALDNIVETLKASLT